MERKGEAAGRARDLEVQGTGARGYTTAGAGEPPGVPTARPGAGRTKDTQGTRAASERRATSGPVGQGWGRAGPPTPPQGPRAGQSGGGAPAPPLPRPRSGPAPRARPASRHAGASPRPTGRNGGWGGRRGLGREAAQARGSRAQFRPRPAEDPGAGVFHALFSSLGPGLPGYGGPAREKPSPVSLNKGDGPTGQEPARRCHCRDAVTFPKMAAGARGRGWRDFRSRRGRGGAAGTHRSPWPPRQTPASPPKGSARTCKPHHSTSLRKTQSPQPVAPGIKPEFLGLDRKAFDQALVSLCPARLLSRGFGDAPWRLTWLHHSSKSPISVVCSLSSLREPNLPPQC
ncbi:translation initiation factor IF-2 isoform X2 [Lutra lutra]|uniref:translation initiation factor IF-2 isoform X2 n=1 Tax=Lutra lutra TaxID=9657 RepID=UPI001FD5A9BB|nr:translation initiation factor IF-2 isoform X2 [Lutra lutra]